MQSKDATCSGERHFVKTILKVQEYLYNAPVGGVLALLAEITCTLSKGKM